jgi:PAS domain S-box-containing protein
MRNVQPRDRSLTAAFVQGIKNGLLVAIPLGLAAALLRRGESTLRSADAYGRAVFDYAVDGILALDDAGVIHSLNPAAEGIFGYAADEIAGRHISELIPDPFHYSQYRLISAGSEVIGRRKDGSTFPMDLTSGKTQAGARRMYIVIARDSTRRKQIEAELRQARAEAELASRAKSAFLAKMSHELRTPLNAIIGYSDMLREEAESAGQDDLVPDLHKINAAGRHLHDLIGNILDIAQIESGSVALSRQPFDVAALVEDVADAARPLAEKNANTLDVRCAEGGQLRGDRARVEQVLFGVVENACKFTQNGTVTIEVVRETNDQHPTTKDGYTNALPLIVFRVRDTGIGMAPEQIAAIFEPFAQADDSFSRRYDGAGLGLTICRRLCELMGGEIAVASAVGEGSTFTIRLPASY